MGKNSKVEWTDATWNPWHGCRKVSAGCDNCYAEKMSGRNPKTLGVWGKHGTRVVASEAMWREPLKWNRAAEQAGERHRVFCASLADVFEGDETIPETSLRAVYDARRRLWELIEATPNLEWLLLTKRPRNVIGKVPIPWVEDRFPRNVWIGTSVEDQKTADERIPHLLQIPAKVRFLSIEPLLGPVELTGVLPCSKCRGRGWYLKRFANNRPTVCEVCQRNASLAGLPILPGQYAEQIGVIDWVIVGGESGPNARPMHPDWVRSIRDQCVEAGVPFFFKQGSQANWPDFKNFDKFPAELQSREFPNGIK